MHKVQIICKNVGIRFYRENIPLCCLFLIFVIFSAAFDEKKPNQMEAKTDRKLGQHPADDRDSDDEMEGEAVDKKEKKPVFKSIVNEIAERYV